MNSDSDLSDSETPNYETMNEHANRFRTAISEWKKEQLDTIIGDNQDTRALNAYLKKTKNTFESITHFIERQGGSKEIDATLLEALGDPQKYSLDTRINILHTLTRDLLEFPFTFDSNLTNSFREDEILQTKIIPNK